MLDTETKEHLTESDHIRAMLDSEGWKIVKGRLDTKILDLQSILNLDLDNPEKLSIELLGRNLAIQTLMTWLKADVYGALENGELQQESTTQDEYIA